LQVNVERYEGARNVTIEMSDSDYAALRHVVGWLEQHAGNDATEYPELEAVTRVVNDIARRREPDSSMAWRSVRHVNWTGKKPLPPAKPGR
jgi:hypothetical protein